MNATRRDGENIVITGIGIVSALGVGRKNVREAMLNGKSGIRLIERFDTSWAASHIGAELENYRAEEYFSDFERARYDLCAQYAILAIREALLDSNLHEDERSAHAGLIFGTCNGGIVSLEEIALTGVRSQTLFKRCLYDYQSSVVAEAIGLQGPVATISTACSASGGAMGVAHDLLRSGQADIMIAGGSDVMSFSVYAGFNALQAMSAAPCSPFSKNHGLSLGEGAAFVVLERNAHAHSRRAHIYAELVSYGLSSDAHHITAPDPEGAGLARAIHFALQAGGVQADDIAYVNAHGTGTAANDVAEILALRRAFDGCFSALRIGSSKPYFGHTLGAAAAIELTSTLEVLESDRLPATLNYQSPRAGCEEARIITDLESAENLTHFVSTNAAFGGNNVALVVRRSSETFAPPAKRPMHAVVITGIGYASSFGFGRGNVLALASDGKTYAARTPFELKSYNRALYERRMNPLTQVSIGAADLALKDAGFSIDADNREQISLIMATSRGSFHAVEKYLTGIRNGGGGNASSIHFPDLVINSTSGRVAIKLDIRGYSTTFCSGGTCGIFSTFHAYELIRDGRQQQCLVGAGDENSELNTAITTALEWPDFGHDLSVFFLLESGESAQNRGVRIYAEVSGFGLRTGKDIRKTSPLAATEAIYHASLQANIDASAISNAFISPALPMDHDILTDAVRTSCGISAEPIHLPEPLRHGHSASSLLAMSAGVDDVEKTLHSNLILSSSAFGNIAATIITPFISDTIR